MQETQEMQVRSSGQEDPLEKGKAAYSSILAWIIHGLYSSWGCKESDTTERLSLLENIGLVKTGFLVCLLFLL